VTRADDLYRALARVLEETTPECTDDPRFLLEPPQIATDELTFIGLTICRPCPIRTECRAYAEQAKPPVGIWAGRTYSPRKRRKNSTRVARCGGWRHRNQSKE